MYPGEVACRRWIVRVTCPETSCRAMRIPRDPWRDPSNLMSYVHPDGGCLKSTQPAEVVIAPAPPLPLCLQPIPHLPPSRRTVWARLLCGLVVPRGWGAAGPGPAARRGGGGSAAAAAAARTAAAAAAAAGTPAAAAGTTVGGCWTAPAAAGTATAAGARRGAGSTLGARPAVRKFTATQWSDRNGGGRSTARATRAASRTRRRRSSSSGRWGR